MALRELFDSQLFWGAVATAAVWLALKLSRVGMRPKGYPPGDYYSELVTIYSHI
jgi:hypothetical protein